MKNYVWVSLMVLLCCNYTEKHTIKTSVPNLYSNTLIDSNQMILANRFHCPDSFKRIVYDTNSFEYYLSHLPLKSMNEKVHYYDGTIKEKSNVYSSVVDLSISPRDLQQCADAVMRLRGEYLYQTKQYSKISFRLLKDGQMYSYLKYAANDYSYKKFLKYMDYVFTYANTSSLYDMMHAVKYEDIKIGDVFVVKGNPYGHAVIVVDMCFDSRGNKQFMLAQSYMPAQEIQILQCPYTQSTWYSMVKNSSFTTPEWTFDTINLRRW